MRCHALMIKIGNISLSIVYRNLFLRPISYDIPCMASFTIKRSQFDVKQIFLRKELHIVPWIRFPFRRNMSDSDWRWSLKNIASISSVSSIYKLHQTRINWNKIFAVDFNLPFFGSVHSKRSTRALFVYTAKSISIYGQTT